MAFSNSSARKRRAVLGLVLGGACIVALAPIGCSSDSTTKKTPTKFNPGGGAGGAAGEATNGGGTAGKSGSTGVAGTSGDAGASTGGTAGDAGASTGGTAGDAGAAGAAGAPALCPDGYGDCDSNPADCETPLTLTTSCGACTTSCDGSHATVACTDAKCVVSACAANYGDCDDDGVTGCETPINTDTHCGDCTRNCAAAGSTCNAGKCAALVLSAHASAYESAQGGDSIYALNTGAIPPSNAIITRIPVNGTTPTQLVNEAGSPGPGVLSADSSFIYWAVSGNPGSVLKKSVTAAIADLDTVVFQPTGTVRYLTIVGNAYYWMTGYPSTYTLFTRPTTAAQSVTGTQIVTTDQVNVTSFAATSDRIYWVRRLTTTAQLVYVPLAGGTPTAVPDAVVADNAPLSVVGTTLYFVREDGGSNALNGVYKYAEGDASVTQLVQSSSVRQLMADASSVYYVLAADGSVYKASTTKPGAGVPIASGFYGNFAGQDATFLYTTYNWGSDGAALKILK